MRWRKSSETVSLEIGPLYDSRFSGDADDPTLLYAGDVVVALRALACSGCGSENAPLTRCPVFCELGSATLSSASPADETTLAVVDASYVCPTPGVNAP